MRTAFIQQLTREARSNDSLFLLVGDLGFSVVEKFAAEFPDRFLNVGIAEQNMAGIAAGLAAEGYHVFMYSIGNFSTLRCLEQIRNDICYHRLPVTVVAVGAGLAYGNLGYSHHCVQDIACLRCMPNMTVLSPGDPGEARACVAYLCKNPGPSYLRIGKAGETTVHSKEINLPSPLRIRDSGSRAAVVATGSVLSNSAQAVESCLKRGIRCDLYSVIQLNPLCEKDLYCLHGYETIITIEEHVKAGGLGELISACLPRKIKIHMLNVPNLPSPCVGSQAFLQALAGLDTKQIAEQIQVNLESH